MQLGSLQCLLAIDLSLQWDPMVMTLTFLPFYRTTPVHLSFDPMILDLS
jgi:hypothetical protein